MEQSRIRYILATNEIFQCRVLILAIQHAQDIMNIAEKQNDEPDVDLIKLKQKATELLNNPESFKERLGLSVAAVLTDADITESVTDMTLQQVIVDVFDGISGVSAARESRLVRTEG